MRVWLSTSLVGWAWNMFQPGRVNQTYVRTCLCGAGYISEDSDGNPACVPKTALVGMYAAVAVVSLGDSGFLLWQAQEQPQRPTCIQLEKGAVLRLRVIMATRFIVCQTSLYVFPTTRKMKSWLNSVPPSQVLHRSSASPSAFFES